MLMNPVELSGGEYDRGSLITLWCSLDAGQASSLVCFHHLVRTLILEMIAPHAVLLFWCSNLYSLSAVMIGMI